MFNLPPGSASVVTNSVSNRPPFISNRPPFRGRQEGVGETRFTTGTMLTDKLSTGQRQIAELGIYHYGARFYSPKLGRFLSADTIVPGYANPQNLNRFSYVTNNPLRYIDPTGHRPEEGRAGKRGCSNSLYCSKGRPKSEQELAQMRRDSRAAKRKEQDGKGVETIIGPSITTIGSAPENQNDSGFSELIDGVGILNNAYEFVSDLGISTRLLKKGFLWGKALNPNPLLDFGLGFAGQAISDLDNPKLTPLQRTNKAVAIGGESLITGVAADLAGGLGFLGGEAIVPEGGGIVGYAVAAAATSLYLDEVAWNNFNASIFPEFGLGAYP